jgi:fructose-bisphosphate aldolase, class I
LTCKMKDDMLKLLRDMKEPGKGILLADEVIATIGKRFEAAGVENTTETRRTFRELLFTTPDIEKHIGGVIMSEETAGEATLGG